MHRFKARRRLPLAVLVLSALAVAGCGGGGAGSTSASRRATESSRSAAEPAGWKRCTNVHDGFLIAYPGGWHLASYERIRVFGTSDAYRRLLFKKVVCENYDPRPFTFGVEGAQTAITVWRYPTAREYRRAIRWAFDARSVRTIQRQSVVVGSRQAIRYHFYYEHAHGLWERAHVYGYLIDFGRKGGIEIRGWRYAGTVVETPGGKIVHKAIPWKQYRSIMAIVDRMAPTAQVAAS